MLQFRFDGSGEHLHQFHIYGKDYGDNGAGSCFKFALSPSSVSYLRPPIKEVMMVPIPVLCSHCQSDRAIKGGTTKASKQRYKVKTRAVLAN
jgi:hypothetical protein